MLALVAREAREAFGADRCAFYVRDSTDPTVAVVEGASESEALAAGAPRFALAGTSVEACLLSGAVVRDDRTLLVPFFAEDQRQAGIAVVFGSPHAFDDFDIVMLRGVAMLVELALEHTKRSLAERERQRRAESLERTTLALRDARGAQDVLAIVARGLAHDLRRPCGAYELRDGEFRLVIASEPAAEAQPLHSSDFDLDTLRLRVTIRSQGRDILAIASDGQLRAVFVLVGLPLDQEETRYLRALSGHVALALSSAQAFDQLRGYAAEGAALNEAARTILGFTEFEPLAEALCRLAMRLVHAERACIYENRGGALELVGCMAGGETWSLPAALAAEQRNDPPGSLRLQLGSLDSDGHGGLLVVSRPEGAFGRWETRLLDALVSLAALALRNVDLYEQSTRANAALAESNAFKDDLMAMFAHDFKGPLTVISGFSELLQETESGEVRRSAETIVGQVRRLARLSEDALALAATQSAGFSLQRRAEDFVAFVVEAVQMLDRGTGRIVVDVPQHPLIVAFDRSRLRHVLDNVVDNALKYSAGPVTVRVAPGESSVRLDVVDRGIGIPAEDLTRIFTRFGRAGNVRARGVAGSGVGLYIAKKIVEVHGGRLSVRSSESEGSTFSISLPLA